MTIEEIDKIIKDLQQRIPQLQIQLHIDNLSQEEFFHSMITAYIYQHPDFVEYIKGVKAQKDEHPKEYKKKVAKTYASYEAVI